MVISQPPGNNPSYYYRASPNAASIALNASRDTYVFPYAIAKDQGNFIEMVLLSIFTRIRSTEGSLADCSYSFCRSMRLLFI